jgi:pimeloyl-ACP methyl ester carboxylesterase
MARIDTRTIQVQGVRSLVRYAGPAHATEAVVFVHGNPGSSEDWTELLEQAGELMLAVAPDMPGYGKADRPVDFDYTVEGYARHLAGLVDALGVSRVHLVLHDFGGPWGMAFGASRPQQIASLSLINTGVLPDYRWHKYARIWRTPIVGELFQRIGTRRALHALMNLDNPKPLPKAFVDRMFDDMDAGAKRAVLKLYRATNDPAATTMRDGAALAKARMPTLVVWGAGDAYLPVKYAQAQPSVFAGAGVHVIENAGHWPFVDEPKQVAEILLPFLRKHVGANGLPSRHAGGGGA